MINALAAACIAAVLSAVLPAFAAQGDAVPTAQGEAVLVAQAQTELIDINRAEADELMTLKGIGEARAAAIVKGRPYARKDELVQKKIIPRSVYNGIKDRIVARH